MTQYLIPAALFVAVLIIIIWPMKPARSCTPVPQEPYWTDIVANKAESIKRDLGIEVLPTSEEYARTMYYRWLKKRSEIAAEQSKKPLPSRIFY
jgi:hypothetical protein